MAADTDIPLRSLHAQHAADRVQSSPLGLADLLGMPDVVGRLGDLSGDPEDPRPNLFCRVRRELPQHRKDAGNLLQAEPAQGVLVALSRVAPTGRTSCVR